MTGPKNPGSDGPKFMLGNIRAYLFLALSVTAKEIPSNKIIDSIMESRSHRLPDTSSERNMTNSGSHTMGKLQKGELNETYRTFN